VGRRKLFDDRAVLTAVRRQAWAEGAPYWTFGDKRALFLRASMTAALRFSIVSEPNWADRTWRRTNG
jgi:hypothetical protein